MPPTSNGKNGLVPSALGASSPDLFDDAANAPWLLKRMQGIVDSGWLVELHQVEVKLLFVCAARADRNTGLLNISLRYVAGKIGVKNIHRVGQAFARLEAAGILITKPCEVGDCPERELVIPPALPQSQREETTAARAAKTAGRGGLNKRKGLNGDGVHGRRVHDGRVQSDPKKEGVPYTAVVKPPYTAAVLHSSYSFPLNSPLAPEVADPLRGTASSESEQITPSTKKGRSNHDRLTQAQAPYRQLTDFWVAQKLTNDKRYEFIPEDGVHLAFIWRATKQDLPLCQDIILAYMSDTHPAVEGHPVRALRAQIDRYRERATTQGAVHGTRATPAHRRGEFTSNIPKGTRSLDEEAWPRIARTGA
jgi:hypothetical protein